MNSVLSVHNCPILGKVNLPPFSVTSSTEWNDPQLVFLCCGQRQSISVVVVSQTTTMQSGAKKIVRYKRENLAMRYDLVPSDGWLLD